MSVSAHLTPEPERRLWLILEHARHEAESAERKTGALAAFAAVEFALAAAPATGALAALAGLALAAAVPVGVAALLPASRSGRRLPLIDPPLGRPVVSDNLVAVEDIAKHAHGELINRLDKYLGGGITATPYYEDLVVLISAHARAAARKRRLLAAQVALVGAAQLLLLLRVAAR